MFKDNINGNRTTSMTLFRYLYCQNIKHFSHFLSISIDDFEQKNARWVLSSVKRESRVSVVDWDLLWHLRFSAPTASCLQITRTLLIGIFFIKCWDRDNLCNSYNLGGCSGVNPKILRLKVFKTHAFIESDGENMGLNLSWSQIRGSAFDPRVFIIDL